jgi:hypothetical protein
MRKSFLFMFLGLFLIGSVSAISTTLNEDYAMGETIIIEIGGNILGGLDEESVEFRRGHVKVPFDFELKKLGDKWFLWALNPENDENYTLVLKDVETRVSGRIVEIDFEQNFSVGGNLTAYYIKPGIIFSKGEDFEIEVFLNEDFDRSIPISFPVEGETLLKPGPNKLIFRADDFEKNMLTEIDIGGYFLKTYIKGDEKTLGKRTPEIIFKPRSIDHTFLRSGNKFRYDFIILNDGEERIEGINFRYDKDFFDIDFEEDFGLDVGQTRLFGLEVLGGHDEIVSDIIYLEYGNESIPLFVEVDFTDDPSMILNESKEDDLEISYCYEFSGGIVCTAGETCDGETHTTVEGSCCVGKCIEPSDGDSKAWIGWLVVLVLFILGIWGWKKYKKNKVNKDPVKDIAKSGFVESSGPRKIGP